MRSIRFGPTNYYGSDDNDEAGATLLPPTGQQDQQRRSSIQRNPNVGSLPSVTGTLNPMPSSQSENVTTPVSEDHTYLTNQNPQERTNTSQRITNNQNLSSAFNSGGNLNSAQDRGENRMFPAKQSQEVIFYAGEDLYRDSVVGTRELAIKKYCKLKLEFDADRTYESYCFEFCGLLNLRFSDIKFQHHGTQKDLPMVRHLKQPCEILVLYSNKQFSTTRASKNQREQQQDFQNMIGPAYRSLFEQGLYSDVEIIVNGETLKAHKCILTARSDKFNTMLNSEGTYQMQEQQSGKIHIKDESISADSFRLMLKWLYTGECQISDSAIQVVPLLQLTDEYMLMDLQRVCEDQIIDYMDAKTAVHILTNNQLVLPQASEKDIKDAAKTVFLEDYEHLLEQDPELEERIFQVKGLMSDLLTHKKKKIKTIRRRRNSIGNTEADTNSGRKKVRFNISSTIYEDASALQDESMSIIEPLSIYSTVSPPQELADVSFPMSTYSMTIGLHTNTSRGAQSSGGVNQGGQSDQSDSEDRRQRNSQQRRPGSAGRPSINRSNL